MPQSDSPDCANSAGSNPLRGEPVAARKINELSWLPIVDTYRTICVAPSPQVRAVLEAIRELGAAF
jgi:hypothetical protein